jgi:L-fuconolactonase
LAHRNLAYDILIHERQLPQTIQFVDRHPNQVFILDHLAKPRIKDWIMSPWREEIRELARRENVFAKISGMVTEADYRAWSGEQLRPYVDIALESFGPRRLMFGSDWPVCLVACGYARWVALVRTFIEKLSPAEQADIMGDTARRAYQLK